MKNFWNNFIMRIFRALFRHEKWEIGIVDASIEKFLDSDFIPQIHWLSGLSKNEFRADPFGQEEDGRLKIYCEHFNYFSEKGWIEKLTLNEKRKIEKAETVFDFPFHVSYPFLFEHDGKKYLIPETQENNSVDLYHWEEQKQSWRKMRTLLVDFPGVDPSVFFDGERFWLMLSQENDGKFEKLFIFHSTNLEAGEFVAHSKNPVKTDISSARSAGSPFFHQGYWYRPTQDCSRVYGRGISINRIKKITPEDFEEETVRRIYPSKDSPYSDGWHTLSAVGDITLIDGKKTVFSLGGFIRFFVRNINRLLGYLIEKIYQKNIK